jgi:cytochrome c2
MNKEVNYVLQGFLLTFVVIGAFQFSSLLLSIKPPPEEPEVVATTDSQKNEISKINGDGRALFQDNCASCHSVFKDMTGPALIGVEERIKDKKLLYAWIRNPQAVLKTGNPYFKQLVKRFDNMMMTPFSSLSDDEIEAILDYIERRSSSSKVIY